MNRRIIINESQIESIKLNIDNIVLPSHLRKSLDKHKTSLGVHPSFPPEDEMSFDEKITLKRFNELRESIKTIEGLNDYNEETVSQLLSQLLKECVSIEQPMRNELQTICFNALTELFNIPEGVVIYDCELVDEINKNKSKLRLTPESVEDIEFDDIVSLENMGDEVYKRRLIDALIIGSSMSLGDKLLKQCIGDIFELNPKLPELYSKIIKLNEYLLFIKNDLKLTDENPQQGGVVNVSLGNDENKSTIQVQAIIFPILLSESIKGFMELFVSHGLPNKKEMASYVIKKADFLLAEPWDMRLGKTLWNILYEAMGEIEISVLPNIINDIVELPCHDFFDLMKEIFGKTKRGREMISDIITNTIHDVEYHDFEQDLIQKRNDNNSIISDEYFTPEELLMDEDNMFKIY